MAHKIFVGLSGGVDSAVSAALLKQQGHDVVGVFIKIWSPEFLECTWKEDRLDALRVCAALDIPLKELDLSSEYKREVVDRMVKDYQRGVTPNPDVLCNRYIKFGAFAEWAKEAGAEGIATGHYARKRHAGAHSELLRATEAAKDQSYFLYRLTQTDLSRAQFPVGGMHKKEVRELAKKLALPVAGKPDSQGLCFVGEVSMEDFLARFIPLEEGPVLDVQGARIGTHRGAALYTLGQRHGFRVESSYPQYVVGVDVATNTVRVSNRREDAARSSVRLESVHWIHHEPSYPCELEVEARYHEAPLRATLRKEGKDLVAKFTQPHIASPGQSLVFYRSEVCLGGGTIL